MNATEKQLKDRWLTDEGKEIRQKLIYHIKEDNWERFLKGFSFVDEIENGKDLRLIDLQGEKLYRGSLSETDLTDANLNNSNLVEANINNSILIKTHLFQAQLYKAKIVNTNLKGAELIGTGLMEADLSLSDLSNSKLWGADLQWSKTIKTIFNNAGLDNSNFYSSDLTGASFVEADLNAVDFCESVLKDVDFTEATMTYCNMTNADISSAILVSTKIYGISAWDIKTDKKTIMKNLIISEEPLITVDDIEIAQFINLIINNKKITNIVTSMRTKSVLILGSFREEEKKILDYMKAKLYKSKKEHIPIVFDFTAPTTQSLPATINVLAYLSKFIIVDLSNPAGQLVELGKIFESIEVPFALILSNKANHVSETIAGITRNKWCYKNKPILYSSDNIKNELNKILEDHLIPWAEKANEKIEDGIIKSRKNIKDLNKILHAKNKDNGN